MNKVIYHNTAFYGRTTTEIIEDGHAYVMVTVMNDNEDVALLHDLVVNTARRGEGLGRMLLEDACGIAADMGAEVIRLSTESGSWLEEWYKRHGFRENGMDATITNYVVLEKPCKEE